MIFPSVQTPSTSETMRRISRARAGMARKCGTDTLVCAAFGVRRLAAAFRAEGGAKAPHSEGRLCHTYLFHGSPLSRIRAIARGVGPSLRGQAARGDDPSFPARIGARGDRRGQLS